MRSTPLPVLLVPLALLAAGPASSQRLVPAPDPAAGVEYFERYRASREAYEAGRLAEAEALLAALASEGVVDGSNDYFLARTRQRLGDAEGAIAAYRDALDHGYRYGAWIAYQIARLHGLLGRPDSAAAWIERSLARGWGERPAILRDTALAGSLDPARLRSLAGAPVGSAPDRDEMWRRDIDFFVAEAKRMHAGPDRPAYSAEFAEAAGRLKRRVPRLSDDRVLLELGRLAALLGDGHTGVYGGLEPASPITLEGTSLPLLFYEFTDGLHVVDATEPHRRWIGAEVVAFGDVPVAAAMDSLASFLHHDNRMTVKWLGVRFLLPTTSFLEAIGATDSLSGASVTVRTRGGERLLELRGGEHVRRFRRKLRPPPMADSVPLWLSRVDTPYWLRPLPSHDALYVQFNQVRDAEDGPSLAQFADTLRRALERSDASALVLDVRHNNGGNNGLLGPLLSTLVWWSEAEGEHAIYVLAGRNTFSAAQNFLARLERMTDPVFVGEPSSSSPNFTGESTNVVLPWTRTRVSISNRHWQESDPDDERPFISPHVPVGLSSGAWLSGEDPVLEAVLRILGTGASPGG